MHLESGKLCFNTYELLLKLLVAAVYSVVYEVQIIEGFPQIFIDVFEVTVQNIHHDI